MLSEKEIKTKMDSLADEYMQKYLPEATVDQFENLSIGFTYKHTVNLIEVTENLRKDTENLVSSTNKLKCFTIALLIATILLLGTAITQIVLDVFCW